MQLIICILSLSLYGFGPVGVELYQGKGQVLSRGLFIEEVDYLEPSNFWFGPRPADLIHLGAEWKQDIRECFKLLHLIEAFKKSMEFSILSGVGGFESFVLCIKLWFGENSLI